MNEIMNSPETSPVTPQDPAAAFLGETANPVDPAMTGAPVDPGEAQVMREDIEEQFGRVANRKAEADEKGKRMAEELDNMKKKMVQDFFALLQERGVDPNNLESINAFLQELEYQNPDLLAMVENFINLAYGEDPLQAAPQDPIAAPGQASVPEVAPEAAPDLMGQQTTDLQNNLLRQ